jgi:hypothetical protein
MATFLQTSGAISMSDINSVFGRGNNLNAYRGTTYYTASTGPNTFSSGAISFNNFYGTGPSSNVVVSLASVPASNSVSAYGQYPSVADFTFSRNGGWSFSGNNGEEYSGLWVTSGASSTVGDGYWILFNRTAVSGNNGTATATTGWMQLNGDRTIHVTKNNSGGIVYNATYTIQIATDSGGSNIVATATGRTVEASRI